jgi:PAS domain S-box-containing protein
MGEDDDELAAMAFRHAPLAMCVTRRLRIAACNHAFAALFGHPGEALLGRSIAMLYPSPQEFRRIGQLGYPRMLQGGHYADERLMRHADGHLFWCRARGRATHPRAPAREAVWTFEPAHAAQSQVERLSPREREVVTRVAAGLTSKEIARELGISPRTVEMHRARVLRKLGVQSTPQLLAALL